MMDLTQSSEDEDAETVPETNRMPTHTEFFLPKFSTTSVLQKGTVILGSAMKADCPYKKEELDQYYTTISTLNSRMNPFKVVVLIKSLSNTTSPITLASCILGGTIRPTNEFI